MHTGLEVFHGHGGRVPRGIRKGLGLRNKKDVGVAPPPPPPEECWVIQTLIFMLSLQHKL